MPNEEANTRKPKIIGDRFALADALPRKGGMAEIYRAADTADNLKPVAVKFMTRTRIHDDRILREAFNRELRALNALDHPNIVRIVDFDPRYDPPYMVLEWLDRDLVSYLRSTALSGWIDFYARIGRPVLLALSYALTKGIVHRDLKPANILVDDNGVPKVADFGISKFYDQAAGGLTLAAFKSEPYAPFEEPPDSSSRDPYSFAVLALGCLAERDFTTHDDVMAALENFQGPPEVGVVLRKALDSTPSSRFANVIELQDAFDRIQTALAGSEVQQRVCYVVVFAQALVQLAHQLDESDENKIRRFLEKEMAEACCFFLWQDRESGRKVPGQFLVRTPQLGLKLSVSEKSGDHLLLVGAWLDETEGYERHGQFGFRPSISFRLGKPPTTFDGSPVIRWLLNAVEQHELEGADARRARAQEVLLREWASTLRFRQDLEQRRYAPVPYNGYRSDGNRVSFFASNVPDGLALEQPRLIRREQRIVLSGVIDDIAADRVVLWVDRGLSEPPPERGQLLIDDRASRIAIERQKGALDAIQYGRCVRPTLRTLLIDPSRSAPPTPPQDVAWVNQEFDEDKKTAILKALGSEDIVVVQGPPGTGKTVFITELVAQLLERQPTCKILLTSQTHVALDNALERIRALRPNARLLRVAQREDERVSERVRELTIELVAERWRADVAKASERFLDSLATDLGVRRDDITLGIAVGRLRAESVELDRIQSRLDDCEKILGATEQELAEAQTGRIADNYQDTSETVDELREQARELNEQKKTVGAKRREAVRVLSSLGELGAQLAKANAAELGEWEEGLLASSEADRKFHNLIQLAEQWQLRFGHSREFYSAMVADSSVVAGTCLGFARVPGILSAEFDLCIVDEASKATPTELMVPLSRAHRWVLVGDTKQLPPFVEDLLDDTKLLNDYELDRASLQRTLLDRFVEGLPESCLASLKTQHRMIRPIGDLISDCFYDGALKSVRDTRDPRLPFVMPAPVTWLTTAGLQRHSESEYDRTFKNVSEARVIGQWLKRLNFIAKTANISYRVGVISGYVGQCTELRRVIAGLQRELLSLQVECNTVDAFQGREVDICVYSVTRCNDRGVIGFLRDARRMNVALSRGRDGLLVVGDHFFCRAAGGINPLRTVVEYIEKHPGDCALTEATL